MDNKRSIISFLQRLNTDKRISPVHISLCMALFFYWQLNDDHMPFKVSRKQLMQFSKIQSTATYHKCVREMIVFGYINYAPDYNHFKGTQVSLLLGN